MTDDSDVKVCPRCGRLLEWKFPGPAWRCAGCGEIPNRCRRCTPIVVEDGDGRFVRFTRLLDGQVEAEEV